MRHTHHRTPITIALAGVLALTVAGCANGGADEPTTSTSSSSSSASGNWDKDHAVAEAEDALAELSEHDVDKPLDADKHADWTTPQYVQAYNQEIKNIHDQQVTYEGKVSTTSVHFKDLDPKATGGPDLTVIACSVSTVRMIGPDGKDVTGDPDTGEPLPKEPQKGPDLVSLTSSDQGESWQLTNIQRLTGKSAQETPCDVS